MVDISCNLIIDHQRIRRCITINYDFPMYRYSPNRIIINHVPSLLVLCESSPNRPFRFLYSFWFVMSREMSTVMYVCDGLVSYTQVVFRLQSSSNHAIFKYRMKEKKTEKRLNNLGLFVLTPKCYITGVRDR